MNTATETTRINITITDTRTNSTIGTWSLRNDEGWTFDGRTFSDQAAWEAACSELSEARTDA